MSIETPGNDNRNESPVAHENVALLIEQIESSTEQQLSAEFLKHLSDEEIVAIKAAEKEDVIIEAAASPEAFIEAASRFYPEYSEELHKANASSVAIPQLKEAPAVIKKGVVRWFDTSHNHTPYQLGLESDDFLFK